MKLTDHFTLAELTASDTARERGIDNTPPPAAVANLKRLAAFLAICAKLRGTPGLAFDQLINEANRQGHRWVHIAIAPEGKTARGEVWTVDATGTREGL